MATDGYSDAMAAWWTTWTKLGEVGAAAPVVAGLRLSRLALAGARPKARDRREARRMGQEKVDAWWDGMVASAAVLGEFNLRMARLAVGAMTAGAAIPLATVGAAGATAAARLGGAGVDPVHRRVRANRRRLTGGAGR